MGKNQHVTPAKGGGWNVKVLVIQRLLSTLLQNPKLLRLLEPSQRIKVQN